MPPTIDLHCEGYPEPYEELNERTELEVTRWDVFHAILTVGAPNRLSFTSRPISRFFYKLGSAISAFSLLEQGVVDGADKARISGWELVQGNGLSLKRDFFDLDMSEKGGLSYIYGMAFAKLIAEFLFDIRWLANADDMLRSGVLKLHDGSFKRGDLVGECPEGNWHVFEAKGSSTNRSQNSIDNLLESAKDQARNIAFINGSRPRTASGIVADLSARPIKIFANDPVPESEGVSFDIEDQSFFDYYYRDLIEYLRLQDRPTLRHFQNHTFVEAPLIRSSEYIDGKFLCSIGLPEHIYRNPYQAKAILKESETFGSRSYEEGTFIGLDGIAIFGTDYLLEIFDS